MEPGQFGWSRSRYEDPAPGSSLDEKEQIVNSNTILFVRFNID